MFDAIRNLGKEERARKKSLKEEIAACEDQLATATQEYRVLWESHKRDSSPKWEYLEVSDKDRDRWGGLDKLGRLGWELVALSTYAEGSGYKQIYVLYVLKRRIPDPPPEASQLHSRIQALKLDLEAKKTNLDGKGR